jgi:predicted nuclease of predicted toxin-antitoxin system
VKFLVDNQLPIALARWLLSQGVECKHVLDLALAAATDAEIWDYACENGCVVISKDEDFLYLANAPSSQARFIWVRIGNCRTKALLGTIERLWPKIIEQLDGGERIVELR